MKYSSVLSKIKRRRQLKHLYVEPPPQNQHPVNLSAHTSYESGHIIFFLNDHVAIRLGAFHSYLVFSVRRLSRFTLCYVTLQDQLIKGS